MKKKAVLALIIGLLAIGAASAWAIKKAVSTDDKHVNIFEKTTTECPGIKWVDAIDSSQMVFPINIEGELYFAGERVPLEDPDVRERLERELQLNAYWHSNTLMSMKLANRYFDELENILTANGVPTDLKYMALIESNFRNDVSPAGAAGFWQFVKGTAKNFDLEVNEEVDERYNIEKSTLAACKFLKDAKEKLGNWTLAVASYNMGLSAMQERVKDQKTTSYYDMYFNPETSRYLFRMIAIKIIFSNPKRAGFFLKPEELYQPYKYKTLEVDGGIPNIADFAAQYNLKYKHIKIVNTWLRDAKLTNSNHKKYTIKIMELN